VAAACIASPAHAQSADWVQQVARTTASKQAYPKTAQARREQGSAKVKIFLVASGAAERAELIAPTGPTALDRAGPRWVALGREALARSSRTGTIPPQPGGATSVTVPITCKLL
jgi:periplasmic protein TonB